MSAQVVFTCPAAAYLNVAQAMDQVEFIYDVFSMVSLEGQLSVLQAAPCYSIVEEKFYRTDLEAEVDFIERVAPGNAFALMTQDMD